MPNGHLLLYDNGWQCRPDPETGRPRRPDGKFSRVVEYALDPDRGTATFVRHHSLHNSFSFFNAIQGVVVPMVNDSWLISWGFGQIQTDSPPDTTATEYNLMTEQELLSLTIRRGSSGPLLETRAYPLGFDVLEQQAEPLAAGLPQSAHTSVFTFGQTDTPTVLVAFGQPVKDFAADTPSVSVSGATITSVAPLIAAGEPANAYLFTLTPDGAGPITLTLLANQDCTAGGICTADGAPLSVVPDAYTIETPVSVSFTQTSFTAMEGASATVEVSLSASGGWLFGITIPIVFAEGGTASADEYTAPESVVFSSGEARQTVSIPIGDDSLIEGDETIALAFGDLPTGVTLGTIATTTVTITDTDTALFGFAIDDGEVGEGATVALTLTLDGDATFATAQTINLTFPSSGATAGVDFTVADSHLQTLTAPYALTLPAGSNSVAATISIVDDAEEEGDETIVVSARHGASALGVKVITILASDAVPLPDNNQPVFGEGRTAARSIAENTGPNRNIGNPLVATDIDSGDTLSYSLGGADDDFFTVVPTSGQLRTRPGVTYDHEALARYEVTVSVSDDDATASIDVTIAVTDVDEPPDAPDAPTVTAAAASPSTSLQVTWMAPATPGRPAVRNYDLRYKLATETAFINGPQDVSGTSATIDDLTPDSTYEVQVRAGNDEGDGPWSASQSGETAVLPAVTLVLSRSSIPENRGMSKVTATVSPASPTPFTLNIWAAAFPPFPGQFETSANNILSFAANETQSTGEVVITGLVPAVVNVAGAVSPAGVLVTRPAPVQLRITEVVPPVMVSFERAAYSLAEGNRVTVKVRFNAPAEQTYTIDLVKTHRDGATEVDYSGLPESLTFDPGDTEQSFSFSALPDTESDDGENVLLEFGAPLPMGVIAGSPAQATLTISTRLPPPPPPPRGGGGGGAPLNRSPEFMEGDRTTRSAAENTPAGANIGDPVAATDFNRDTLTYSLRGLGSDLFDVDASSGQLLTKDALDYETESSYIVFVWVQDNKNTIGRPDTERDTVIRIELMVTNEDEAGTVALSLSEPDVDVPITAALTDPDGDVARVVWSWARSADQTAWTAIRGAALASYTPVAADKGSYLRATASYTDAQGPRKSAQAATAAPVPSNAEPAFTDAQSSAMERSVAENTNVGEAVGAPIAATDAEDDALTYALGGPDAALFAIDPDTRQIRVGAGTTLDYEADKNVYEVTVTATDSLGVSATVTVTIAVTNVGVGSPIADAYDADGNEAIDQDEAVAALVDYFSGAITKEEAIEVLRLYFAG